MSDHDTAARVRMEAEALPFALAQTDAVDACAKLDGAAFALAAWLYAVRHEVENAPGMGLAGLPSLWAVLDRPEMKQDRDTLDAAGVTLEGLISLDPERARQAYAAALADTKRAGEQARMETAAARLAAAMKATDETERARLRADALHELTRPEAEGDIPLAEAWDAYLAHCGDVAKDGEVLRLDERRGTWARWFNDMLGIRGGLEPGQTVIIGGAPEAGKTTLAALLAVDALAARCPVLFWQLELSREETLENLQAQRIDLDGWPDKPFWRGRRHNPLPPAWADLLAIPRWPASDVEAVWAALVSMTRQADRAARAGANRHACKGLVIVDYMQRVTVADAGPRNAQHEILCTAASLLAKAAAETGACLLLLSQLNKLDQRTTATTGTALAGADLARMAHRVALLQGANAAGKPCGTDKPYDDPCKGRRRVLTWTKARGVRYTNGRRPDDYCTLWDGGQGRAFHGGDGAASVGIAYFDNEGTAENEQLF
jgi:DnaB-like helicase C terminal domain